MSAPTLCKRCSQPVAPKRAALGYERCIECARTYPAAGAVYVQTAAGFKNNGASLTPIANLAEYQRDNHVRG